MPTKEELLRATVRARDAQFAALFTLQLGIAVETHPDVVRTALAQVFSLEAVEESCRRMMLVLANAQGLATQAHHLLAGIRADLDTIEQRMDAIVYEQQLLENPAKGIPNHPTTLPLRKAGP